MRLDYAPSTIADGARTVQIGERTFVGAERALRGHLARRTTTPRAAAMALVWDAHEAADRADLGAGDRGRSRPGPCPGERIGVVLSGGNVDAAALAGTIRVEETV